MSNQFNENTIFIQKGDAHRTKLIFLRYPKIPKQDTFPLEWIEDFEEVIVQHPEKGELRFKVADLDKWDGKY